MEIQNLGSNVLSFFFKDKFRRPILLLVFPIIFGFALFFPPYICEERHIMDGGPSIRKYIEWRDHILHPPFPYKDENPRKTVSYTVDYFQWITLLSGIAFLNISFYVLTKNDSKIK